MSLTRHCTGTSDFSDKLSKEFTFRVILQNLPQIQLPLALTLLPDASGYTPKFNENHKKEVDDESDTTNQSDTDYSPSENSFIGEEEAITPETEIADLHVVSQLGEGTQGTVYLVQHKTNLRKFALKVCRHLTTPRRNNNVDEIRNEAMVLKQLSHPFIINLDTFCETSKHTYLLLEYCPGGDLFYHMTKMEESKRKRFSESTIKFYV